MPIIRRNNSVYVTLGTFMYCYCVCIPDSHPHRITSAKCRINTVVSPDDGHIVARNMYRLINILRINCAPSWLYLQDYTGMYSEQNTLKNATDIPEHMTHFDYNLNYINSDHTEVN